jgi:3-isopropylmalate dehydrogenase
MIIFGPFESRLKEQVMILRIAVLPGDGIGPEVTREAVKVLRAVADKFGHQLKLSEYLIGGRALDRAGRPLPEETLDGCLNSDAVLLGAVGGAQYDSNPRGLRPEDGLLKLRRSLGTFANLRPVIAYEELLEASPLKSERARGCDLLIVRELLGGLYFGRPRGFESSSSGPWRAYNTMSYTVEEIERIARVAFQAALRRRRKLTSVDKSNVLETSQLWRKIVSRVARDYPQVELEHMLVDSCAMEMIRNPRHFDVILTENLFGDILSDEAAVIAGSIGLLPSASLGGRAALYEPVHGSAPDIAGKNKANPLGAVLSVAMMLRYSFNLEAEAQAIERAVAGVLKGGLRTEDISAGGRSVGTSHMGDAVCQAICDS